MKSPRTLQLSILISCLWLVGCETTSNRPAFAGYKSPYQGNSGVSVSPALEQDAIKSLRAYLKQVYGSTDFEIIDRKALGEIKGFVIDGRGRLVTGSLHEVWTIRRGDKVEQLEFIMFSDGNRGNTVGFKEYEAR